MSKSNKVRILNPVSSILIFCLSFVNVFVFIELITSHLKSTPLTHIFSLSHARDKRIEHLSLLDDRA